MGGAREAGAPSSDATPRATLAIIADCYEDGWRATVVRDGATLDRRAPTLVELLAGIAIQFDHIDRRIE